jgi:hypothetical protein
MYLHTVSTGCKDGEQETYHDVRSVSYEHDLTDTAHDFW